MTSAGASDWIGQRVREIRDSRGWTANDLAARCGEAGSPEITKAVLANIEGGRRDKDGTRRREVTVDELLALALALEVPPLLLFVPLSYGDTLQVTRVMEMDPLESAVWVTGERDAPDEVDGLAVLSTREDPARWVNEWRRRAGQVSLLRRVWQAIRIFSSMLAVPGEDPGAELSPETARNYAVAMEETTRQCARWIDSLAALGITPPRVPAPMARIMRSLNMLEIASPDDLTKEGAA